MRHKTRQLWWGIILFIFGMTIAYLQSGILAYHNPHATTFSIIVEIFWLILGVMFGTGGLYVINQSLEP